MELPKIARFCPQDNVQTVSDCIAIFFVRSSRSNVFRYRRPSWFSHVPFPPLPPSPPPSVDTRPRWPPVNARAWSRRSYEKKGTVNSLHFLISFLLQLESLRSRLDDREEQLKQKEKKLISVSSEHSENSYAVENLQSVLSTKERQVTSLKKKVCSMYSVLLQVLFTKCVKVSYFFLFSLSDRLGS